jgi:hypothetical protein
VEVEVEGLKARAAGRCGWSMGLREVREGAGWSEASKRSGRRKEGEGRSDGY